MRKSVISQPLLALILGCAGAFAAHAPAYQTPETSCPAVYVFNCPDSCESDERPCTFAVEVKGARPGQKLTYTWEVSKGKIKSGQGTDTITVDLSGVERKGRIGITAAVDVDGIEKGCNGSASCSTAVY